MGHKAERWYRGQDSEKYHLLVLNRANGRGSSRDAGPPYSSTLYREPRYPAFVGAIVPLRGTRDDIVAVVQSRLVNFSALLAALLPPAVFGDPRIAFLGGLWVALSPDLDDHPRYQLSEALFVPLLLLGTVLAFHTWRVSSTAGHALAGLGFTLAGSARIITLPVAAADQLLLLLVLPKLSRQRLLQAVVLGLVVAAAVAPWIVPNGIEGDHFVFTSRDGAQLLPRGDKGAAPLEKQLQHFGVAAWIVTYPFSELMVPSSRLHQEPFIWEGPLGDFEKLDTTGAFARYSCDANSIVESDACQARIGLQLIATYPLQYASMTAVEWVWLTFYPYPSRLSLTRNWTVWLGMLTIVAGFLTRCSREQVWPVLLIVAYTLPSVLGGANPRYGGPLVPFYSLFAAAGLARLVDTLLSRAGFRLAQAPVFTS